MVTSEAVARLPYLGSGLGYRREFADALLADGSCVDFVEILTDQFIENDADLDEVRRVCARFPAVPHGVGLSVGSATGLDRAYLAKIKKVSDVTGSSYYSEHLCMTRAPGIDIGHLSPLMFTEDTLRCTIRNVTMAQDFLDKPLVLENVTYVVEVPYQEMSQAEFFGRLVDATGCGVLLDVTNLYINATNHRFDALDFLAAMPLDRIVQVHLAGGFATDGFLVDSHSEAVGEEVWELFATLAGKTRIRACVVEHDANFPHTLAPLIDQVNRARSLLGDTAGTVADGRL